jgi:hypothetical protein
VWLMILQRVWQTDRFGTIDDGGCPDDEYGNTDEGRKEGLRETGRTQIYILVVRL